MYVCTPEKMVGGEIFIEDKGVAEIGDIAKYFPEFYGLNDNISIIGPKPGEKLYEALYTEEESMQAGLTSDNYIIILPEEKILAKASSYWNNSKLFNKFKTPSTSLRSDQISKDQHLDPSFFLSIL